MPTPQQLIEAHEQAGTYFEAAGVQSFVRQEGDGEPVVCMHGVPSSSYLYRKLLPVLGKEGYRGIAFDLPGLGLAQRPQDFDYSWTGLGKWSSNAVDSLGLDRYHLVIHDIGGPVGMEMVARQSERILSLTILNTLIVNLPQFKKPWSMRPFGWKGIGELYLASMQPQIFAPLMYLQGVEERSAFSKEDGAAYVHLLKREDKGRAFLQIMRSFENTQAKEDLYLKALKQVKGPKQIIWGAKDPALSLNRFGRQTQEITGVERFFALPAKHFLQEDQAPEIGHLIREMNQ